MGWGNCLNCDCPGGPPPGPAKLCVYVEGCRGTFPPGASITITDALGNVTTGTDDPTCATLTGTGDYSISASATGYFSRNVTFTVTSTAVDIDVIVILTPTEIGVCVTGCNGLPVPGATVTLTGPATGSCTTGVGGNCTLSLSNALDGGDTYTITVSKARFETIVHTVTTAANTANKFGGTLGGRLTLCGSSLDCNLNFHLIASDGHVCCFDDCWEPICDTVTLSTPFGDAVVELTPTFGSPEAIASFTFNVLGFPYFGTGPTYGSNCNVYGATPVSVPVTFHVRMGACGGNLSVSYACCSCGLPNLCEAAEDLPPGGHYIMGVVGSCPATLTTATTTSCPEGLLASTVVSGSKYCNGTYTITEACGMMGAIRHRPDPNAPKPAAPYRPLPPAPPPDGRVRFGVVSPCDGPGGAEQWISNVLETFDRSRLRCDGIAIRHEAQTTPNRREGWAEHAPVAIGPEGIREVAARVDVLLTWGIVNLPWGISPAELKRLVPKGLPVISCSQGSSEYPEGEAFDTIDVAVSKAALRGIPKNRRDRARIIYNGAPSARVANGRDHDEIRAEWGVEPGAKVVGWMGRLSPEKGYLRFIEGVAMLPEPWVGVMCGTGFEANEMEAKWLIDAICPGRVKMVGYCSDVGDALAAFDCLLMTSDTEGLSLSAAEAMRAGCPLVTTPVGLYEDRPDLATILPMSPTGREIAAAVVWQDHDAINTGKRLSEAGWFAEAELSMEALGRKWSDLMVEVAARPKPRRTATEEVRLTVLRNKCPHGSRIPGCSCTDFNCSKFDARVTREDCFGCLEGGKSGVKYSI